MASDRVEDAISNSLLAAEVSGSGDNNPLVPDTSDQTTPLLTTQESSPPPPPPPPPPQTTTTTTTATATAIEEEEEEVVPHNPWSEQLGRIQLYLNLLSHVLAMVSIVLIVLWVDELGGLSWDKQYRSEMFNYHPLFMILAFAFMTIASLKYRVSHACSATPNRKTQKTLHAVSNTVVLVLGIVAVVAVFRSHNDCHQGQNCYANLASLHSWIGMAIIILFLCQFIVASTSFGPIQIPFLTPRRKAGILRIHHFFGRFIYAIMAANICLGIQEKEQFAFKGCSYPVPHKDTNPAQYIGRLSIPCKISHSLGIIIITMACTTLFAIHDFDLKPANATTSSRQQISPLPDNTMEQPFPRPDNRNDANVPSSMEV